MNRQIRYNLFQLHRSIKAPLRKVIKKLCPVKFTANFLVITFFLSLEFVLVSHSTILNSICPWFSWYFLAYSSPALANHSVSSLDFSFLDFPQTRILLRPIYVFSFNVPLLHLSFQMHFIKLQGIILMYFFKIKYAIVRARPYVGLIFPLPET